MKKYGNIKLSAHFFQVGSNSREAWNHNTISVHWVSAKRLRWTFRHCRTFNVPMCAGRENGETWKSYRKLLAHARRHIEQIFIWFYLVFTDTMLSVEQVVCFRILFYFFNTKSGGGKCENLTFGIYFIIFTYTETLLCSWKANVFSLLVGRPPRLQSDWNLCRCCVF